jgi:hypothetical protein
MTTVAAKPALTQKKRSERQFRERIGMKGELSTVNTVRIAEMPIGDLPAGAASTGGIEQHD